MHQQKSISSMSPIALHATAQTSFPLSVHGVRALAAEMMIWQFEFQFVRGCASVCVSRGALCLARRRWFLCFRRAGCGLGLTGGASLSTSACVQHLGSCANKIRRTHIQRLLAADASMYSMETTFNGPLRVRPDTTLLCRLLPHSESKPSVRWRRAGRQRTAQHKLSNGRSRRVPPLSLWEWRRWR